MHEPIEMYLVLYGRSCNQGPWPDLIPETGQINREMEACIFQKNDKSPTRAMSPY